MWSDTQAAQVSNPTGKLDELRAKTDRDLAVLLRHAIDRSAQALGHADYAQAEGEYARAAVLLPLTTQMPAQNSRELRTRLAELRAELDKQILHC
jgi:hypothetical protein